MKFDCCGGAVLACPSFCSSTDGVRAGGGDALTLVLGERRGGGVVSGFGTANEVPKSTPPFEVKQLGHRSNEQESQA